MFMIFFTFYLLDIFLFQISRLCSSIRSGEAEVYPLWAPAMEGLHSDAGCGEVCHHSLSGVWTCRQTGNVLSNVRGLHNQIYMEFLRFLIENQTYDAQICIEFPQKT